MKLLILTDGINGVVYHRLFTPHLRMQIDGQADVSVCQSQEEWLTLDYRAFDVIIFSRWLGSKHYDVLKKIADSGTPYVVDIDDYWILPKYNPAYWAYRKGIKQCVKDSINYADAVITTTPALAKEIRLINENVIIASNCLDYTHKQWEAEPMERTDKVKVGWVGGVTHEEDLKLIADQIKGMDIEFYICGYTPGEIWNRIAKSMPNAKIVEGTTVFEYGEVYRHFDFVVAPLQDTKFNNCKSELKIVEASAYKKPIICSAVYPYLYHQANDGVLLVTQNDWRTAIEKMIDVGHSVRQSMGLANYDYCQKHHNLELHNLTRLQLYKSLCK
jgi:glycosyltransferase involved in cell wall biosynthesis